ncbi:MAG: thiol:disulfide interchange protein DsbA/DsbL [Candidatus Dechloromonas phosphoritropha]|jgi:thiol:disulfide interchange protein DsbA
MQFARRTFLGVTVAAALAVGVPALAQTAGKDYTPVSPAQPTDDPAKIEVLEFFSYGCPHCSDFHPQISTWAAKLPGDVVFKRVPITFGRAAWANLARIYYSLEATGDLARLDGEVFKAIHNDRLNLFEEKSIIEWVAKKGVDQKKFTEAFNSFGVMSKVKRGDQLAQAYKIQGVPAVAVDGKYLVGGSGFNEVLATTDKLIAKARGEKAGKK